MRSMCGVRGMRGVRGVRRVGGVLAVVGGAGLDGGGAVGVVRHEDVGGLARGLLNAHHAIDHLLSNNLLQLMYS